MPQLRMLYIKRCEPVAQCVEEGKTFHLRETAEIDIGSAFLHVRYFAEALFELFHLPVISIGMQNILQC